MAKYYDAKGNPIEIAEPKVSVPEKKYYDAKGNPIEIREPLSEPPTQINPIYPGGYSKLANDTNAQVEADNKKEDAATFRHDSAKLLPGVLGLAGSFAGPAGMGTGSLVGSLLQKMIEKQSLPDSGDILESAATAAPDFLIPGISESLATSKPLLKAKLAKMLFSGNQTAERNAALSVLPDAAPSVGQMTGSRTANLMENYFAPSARQELNAGNQPLIDQGFQGLIRGTNESRAANIRGGVEAGMENLKGNIRTQTTNLSALGNHNTVSYDVITGQEPSGLFDAAGNAIMKDVTEPRKVAGPIYFKEAVGEADAFLAGMRKKYGAKSNVDLVPLVPEAQQPLVRYAQNISGTKAEPGTISNWRGPIPNQIDAKGIHPVDLETALDWKTATGDKGYAKELGGDNTQRLWKNLNSAISRDLKNSIPEWQGGQQALGMFEKRNQLNTTLHDLYLDRAPANKNLLESKGVDSGISDVEGILNDPVKISKTISGSSNRTATREDLLGSWVENVYSRAKSYDEKTQGLKFNASGPMSEFLDPKNEPILKKLVPNQVDRDNLGKFFQSVSILGPGESNNGLMAIRATHRTTRIVLPALTMGLVGTGAGAGVAATGAAVEVGLNQFVKRVLLNSEVARLIPRLSSLPPSSPEGRAISRLIFSALKGAEMTYTDAQGNKIESSK